MKTKKGNLSITALVLGMLLALIMASSIVYFKNEIILSSNSGSRLEEFYNYKAGVTRLIAELQHDVYYLDNNRSGNVGISNFSYTVKSVSANETTNDITVNYIIDCTNNTYRILANTQKDTGIINVDLQQ